MHKILRINIFLNDFSYPFELGSSLTKRKTVIVYKRKKYMENIFFKLYATINLINVFKMYNIQLSTDNNEYEVEKK